MLSLKLCTMSDMVIRNGETNTISIVELLEDISSPSFPILVPRLTSFWLLEKESTDEQEFEGEIVFLMNDRELHRFPIGINFQDKNRTRNIVGFGGFLIPEPGELRAEFSVAGQVLGSYSVEVISIDNPQITAASV